MNKCNEINFGYCLFISIIYILNLKSQCLQHRPTLILIHHLLLHFHVTMCTLVSSKSFQISCLNNSTTAFVTQTIVWNAKQSRLKICTCTSLGGLISLEGNSSCSKDLTLPNTGLYLHTVYNKQLEPCGCMSQLLSTINSLTVAHSKQVAWSVLHMVSL